MKTLTTRMVQTKYHGPTNTKGSRVSATNVNTRKRITIQWDHALNPRANHETAARISMAGFEGPYTGPLLCSSIENGGYIFAMVPLSLTE